MVMTSRGGSTRRWRKLRAFVLRRDGGKCQRCGGNRKLGVSPRHSANGGRARCSLKLPDAVLDVSR